MDIGTIVAVGGFILTCLGIAVIAGSLKNKIEVLDERAKEDRQANKEKFAELYCSRSEMQNEITGTIASLKAVCDRLERLEPKLDELLKQGGKP